MHDKLQNLVRYILANAGQHSVRPTTPEGESRMTDMKPSLEPFADSKDLTDALDYLARNQSGELGYYLKEAAEHIRDLYRVATKIAASEDELRKAATWALSLIDAARARDAVLWAEWENAVLSASDALREALGGET